MNVTELIHSLQSQPRDMQVLVEGYEAGIDEINSALVEDVVFDHYAKPTPPEFTWMPGNIRLESGHGPHAGIKEITDTGLDDEPHEPTQQEL